jgi:prevent-host-death family protein
MADVPEKPDKPGQQDKPVWDYDRRVNEGDFGDAAFVTTKELRAGLAEILNRVAYGGDQIVVTRHGKPFVAIVATYDLQACQALEDYNDVAYMVEMEENGELERTMPWEQVREELGLSE